MIDKQAVALINHDLELKWGKRYRVVWCDDEYEVRENVYGEVGKWPKYSYLKERFLLEKFLGNEYGSASEEIKVWNGWEILHAFAPGQDPTLAACMFLADCIENGVKRTLQDHYNAEKDEFDKEVLEAYEILENESPYIATMLKNKEAIVVPGKKDE